MPAESPIFEQQEAQAIRRQVGDLAREALSKLADELAMGGRAGLGLGVTETWAKKFKIVADQIRRDFRLEGEAAAPPAGQAIDEDPLAKLHVVSEEDEEVA